MSKENGMIGCIGHDGDCCKDREELERDAARYRWLKERFFGADFDWNKSGSCAIVFEWPEGSRISADLNKSIDDAMPNTDNTLTETGKVLTETNFDALCDLLPSKTNWGDTLTPGIVEQIALAEREACAKGCEQLSHIGSENQLWMRDRCAAFIRSRSNVELTSGPHGATKE